MPITPHLVVRGADRAAAFYVDAFGAEELDRLPVPGGRLMSVRLRIGGGLLQLADEFPEMGVLAPPSIGGTAVVLALMSPTRKQCSRRRSKEQADAETAPWPGA